MTSTAQASPWRATITGLVLAGGRARRLGGVDKGLVEVAGRPMASHVVERLRAQVGTILVNANRNPERYREVTGCQVIPDCVGEYAGPLAGMASGLQAAGTDLLLAVPCDSPLLHESLAARLHAPLAGGEAEISVARDAERMQPVFAMLHRSLLGSMLEYLGRGESKIDRWYAAHRVAEVDFSAHPEMFLNVNTPEDRDAMERRLAYMSHRTEPRTHGS